MVAHSKWRKPKDWPFPDPDHPRSRALEQALGGAWQVSVCGSGDWLLIEGTRLTPTLELAEVLAALTDLVWREWRQEGHLQLTHLEAVELEVTERAMLVSSQRRTDHAPVLRAEFWDERWWPERFNVTGLELVTLLDKLQAEIPELVTGESSQQLVAMVSNFRQELAIYI